jgi:hypothetical protein
LQSSKHRTSVDALTIAKSLDYLQQVRRIVLQKGQNGLKGKLNYQREKVRSGTYFIRADTLWGEIMTITVMKITRKFNSPSTCGYYHGSQMLVLNASWHTPSRAHYASQKNLCDL